MAEPPKETPKETPAVEVPAASPVESDAFVVSVAARPLTGLWTLVPLQIDSTVLRVRITAPDKESWQYGESGERCGPGGVRKRGVDCLCMRAPLGALIGKFGGSNADDTSLPDTAAVGSLGVAPWVAPPINQLLVFPVGSFCEIPVPNTSGGMLFLTINDNVSRFGFHDGSLEVQVHLVHKFGEHLV